MSLIPGPSSGSFGDGGFEDVGAREAKDNWERVLGEPLAVCWVIVRGVERLEDASPDAIGSPQTLVEDMATMDQGPVQPTPGILYQS